MRLVAVFFVFTNFLFAETPLVDADFHEGIRRPALGGIRRPDAPKTTRTSLRGRLIYISDYLYLQTNSGEKFKLLGGKDAALSRRLTDLAGEAVQLTGDLTIGEDKFTVRAIASVVAPEAPVEDDFLKAYVNGKQPELSDLTSSNWTGECRDEKGNQAGVVIHAFDKSEFKRVSSNSFNRIEESEFDFRFNPDASKFSSMTDAALRVQREESRLSIAEHGSLESLANPKHQNGSLVVEAGIRGGWSGTDWKYSIRKNDEGTKLFVRSETKNFSREKTTTTVSYCVLEKRK